MVYRTRSKWLSPAGFGGLLCGAVAAAATSSLMDGGTAAGRTIGASGLVLAGYLLGVTVAYSRQERNLLDYILRLRRELRLTQDQIMELASFRSLGTYVDAAAASIAQRFRSLRGSAAVPEEPAGQNGNPADQARRLQDDLSALEAALGPLGSFCLTRPARAPFNLNGLLREAIDLCRHRAEEKKIIFDERYAIIPPVFGPAGRLQQALLNVIINAIEAMPFGGGTILVETSHGDGHVVGRVQDPGIGIRPEHLPRVFEPFFTTKPEKSSAGLGLWATREMLRMIGAAINIHSAPHQGTTVILTFPEAAPLRAGRTGTENPPELDRNTADEGDRRIA